MSDGREMKNNKFYLFLVPANKGGKWNQISLHSFQTIVYHKDHLHLNEQVGPSQKEEDFQKKGSKANRPSLPLEQGGEERSAQQCRELDQRTGEKRRRSSNGKTEMYL